MPELSRAPFTVAANEHVPDCAGEQRYTAPVEPLNQRVPLARIEPTHPRSLRRTLRRTIAAQL